MTNKLVIYFLYFYIHYLYTVIMASTRNRNNKAEYLLEQKRNIFVERNRTDAIRTTAYTQRLPDAGINVGHVPSNQLTKNATDVESSLFGISSSNLVNPTEFNKPKYIPRGNVAFFERMDTFIPEPLVVEYGHRPMKPM